MNVDEKNLVDEMLKKINVAELGAATPQPKALPPVKHRKRVRTPTPSSSSEESEEEPPSKFSAVQRYKYERPIVLRPD